MTYFVVVELEDTEMADLKELILALEDSCPLKTKLQEAVDEAEDL